MRLQRDLIAKSDLLTEVLRDKHDLQRRKVGSGLVHTVVRHVLTSL